MSNALADRLQIWGFENRNHVFGDGSLGFGLRCRPIDISCWSDEKINSLSEDIGRFLNGLPTDTDIQFVQEIEPGNAVVLEGHLKLAGSTKSKTASSMTSSRCTRYQALDRGGEIPVHDLLVLVRKKLSAPLVKKMSLFSNEKAFPEMTEEQMNLESESLERLKENITEGLRNIGLTSTEVSQEEMASLLYRQWNPDRTVELGDYDPDEIRSTILFSDVGIDISGFVIGKTHYRLLSLKNLPDQTVAGMASHLRELSFKSKLVVSVNVPDQLKEIESLKTQRRIAFSMVVGKRNAVADIESSAKLQDLETLLEQMIAQGQKVFHVGVQVILQSTDELDLDRQVEHALTKFRELNGAEAMVETLAAFDIFSQIAIPNARVRDRIKRIKTSNLADLIPLFGPWRGHSKASVLLRTRQGSLLTFDPFDSSLANANQLVSGGSGSGKSFMTNLLLLQMLKENPKVFFVDIGGSYRKLAENLDGQYIELGVNDQISINPFDLPTGESKPSSQKIKFLVGLVEIMTKEDGADRLPKLVRAEVEACIENVFNSTPRPRLRDLKDILLSHENVDVRNIGRILNSWCGDTPYGKFIDRPTSIELDRDVVAFDLKGLENYPDLQAVCLYLITDLVWRVVQKDRSQMKFLVFDECWKLLKDEAGMIFMEEVFRTFRKYFASAIAISQDLNDFLGSKIAAALVPNCSVKWILMQNQSNLSRMQDSLGLNENEILMIKSLHQKKGEYSEAFLIAGQEHHTVAVIEPSPLELWISTTDPRDLALIETAKAKAPTRTNLEILEELAERFPRGASQANGGIP